MLKTANSDANPVQRLIAAVENHKVFPGDPAGHPNAGGTRTGAPRADGRPGTGRRLRHDPVDLTEQIGQPSRAAIPGT